MPYSLDQFSSDCRAALLKDPGPAGREQVRQYTERACSDPDFVAKHLGPDATDDRKILYEDPDLKFCILAHVYKGEKNSNPHDHGPSWAVYGQVAGVTEMTDWRLLQKPADGAPGKVAKVRTWSGVAKLFRCKRGTTGIYQFDTRRARSVFQRLGRPRPSSVSTGISPG